MTVNNTIIQLIIISLLLIEGRVISGANILAILPTPMSSHFNAIYTIVETLATEHNVTFYTVKRSEKSHANITMKKLPNLYLKKEEMARRAKDFHRWDPVMQWKFIFDTYNADYCRAFFQTQEVQGLLNASKDQYQLMIVFNALTEAFYKFAHLLEIPMLQVVTSISTPWTNAAIGIRNNLAYDLGFSATDIPRNFVERIQKFLKQLYLWWYYEWNYLPSIEPVVAQYFPPGTPTIKHIHQHHTNGLIVYNVPAMGYGYMYPGNVINVGGLHCRRARPLPDDLERFVSGSEEYDGVIYFSLGNTITDEILEDQIRVGIWNVFRRLKQRVLYKSDGVFEDRTSNIFVSKWFPQQDVLGHNKTKLMIAQGGMLTMQEAVYHGVPVLVLPVFIDQYTNGRLAENLGYGRVLKWPDFNEDLFYHRIQELLTNKTYKERAERLSVIVRNRLIESPERLRSFVDFMIGYNDTLYTQPNLKDLNQFQIMELDVSFTIFTFVLFVVFSVVYFCLLCVKRALKVKVKEKEKKI